MFKKPFEVSVNFLKLNCLTNELRKHQYISWIGVDKKMLRYTEITGKLLTLFLNSSSI